MIFAGISLAIQTFIGKFWWQIPLVAALALGALRWDHNRIEWHVEKGKTEVRVEIGNANAKAVETADRVRAKSAAPGVRSVQGNKRDPYTVD